MLVNHIDGSPGAYVAALTAFLTPDPWPTSVLDRMLGERPIDEREIDQLSHAIGDASRIGSN